MARTLLLGTHKFTWREWLKTNLGSRDLLALDPFDPNTGSLGRVSLIRNGKIVSFRFVGSLDSARNPIAVLQGLAELLAEANLDVVIQLPSYRAAPVQRQLLHALAQVANPDEILVPEGATIPLDEWPIGPETVTVEGAFPEMVQAAQRRARWIEMIENSYDHSVPLHDVSIQGTRLGSGTKINTAQLSAVGLEGIVWAEKCGSTLLLVTKNKIGDRQIGMALNVAHASKLQVVEPMAYSGRLCSLARQRGEDFAMGIIEEIDFVAGVAQVLAHAVPPAPVRILKIGSMLLDSTGRELGDEKPWTI